jgi:rhodanese-related sulfurtransferase
MGFLSNLFSSGPKVDLKELLNSGALLIDVRTKNEFAGGHAKNSKNIPLNELANALPKLKKEQNIIVVCASGARSSSAVSMMKRDGFINCYNGGSWMNFR